VEEQTKQPLYSRTLTEALTQQRDRSFALAQLQGLSVLDDKIKNLSVVTSPYTLVSSARLKSCGRTTLNYLLSLLWILPIQTHPSRAQTYPQRPALAPTTPSSNVQRPVSPQPHRQTLIPKTCVIEDLSAKQLNKLSSRYRRSLESGEKNPI